MSTSVWSIALVAFALLWGGMAAAPPQQETTPTSPFAPPVWVSPTPDATGAIVVIVQPGESLWIIAARAGLSLPELLALNGLTDQSIINPGDAIIIGQVTPPAISTPDEGSPTATLPPPTPRPTEPRPEAAVCLTAFDDLNRNGIREATEPLRAGVAFTVYNTEAVVANYITDGRSEPRCLRGLSPGSYRVTRSVAPGEVLTTGGDWSLNLSAGGELYQAFGSVMGEAAAGDSPATGPAAPPATGAVAPFAATPAPPFAGDGDGRVTWISVAALFLGGLLLLAAVLILLIRQSRNRRSPPASVDGERRFQNIDDPE